jgi:hypothetical protein
MRLGAKPNRNEQGSAVVRQRCAAFASVGCMEPGAGRRLVSRMGIIGTARVQKRRSRQSGTSTCYRAWHENPEKGVLAGAVVEMFSRCQLLLGLQKTQSRAAGGGLRGIILRW